MTSPNEFRYFGYAQEIIFGPGALARLSEAVERFGWRRLLLCTTGSARRLGHAARGESLLGERLLATYDPVLPHVPENQVIEASIFLKLARQRVEIGEIFVGIFASPGKPIHLLHQAGLELP